MHSADAHLGDSVIAAFVLGELAEHERGEVDAHIDGCTVCHELVGAFARAQTDAGTIATPQLGELGDEAPARGGAIGRYLVLERLGEGGMGVVLLAYDPELDRKVAIKLLRAATTRDPEQASQRLKREAQAMARLSHRNVVGVFDVGVHEGHVFVAMEYVAGDTLAGWLAKAPRRCEEIVAVFVDVARGLQAAHAAGIVHRDVKPTNVLISLQGELRVAVTDFGLARRDQEPELAVVGRTASSKDSTPLTQSGAVLGTPAYMSPEQHAGASVDAKSDQFSFCVALWQALWNELPYAGRSAGQIAAAIDAGELRTPPKDEVPDRIRRALVKGLAREPSDRFADMDALVLAIAPPRHNRGRIALGAAVLGLLGAPLVFARDDAAPPCAGAETALGEVWDDGHRDALRASFTSLMPGRGEVAADRVITRLDRHADAFVGGWRDACEAFRVRKEQSQQTFDLRMACLDRKRRATAAIISVWSSLPDAAAVDRVAAAVEELPRIDACADEDALHEAVPLPDDATTRERIAAARDRLAEAFALQQAGRMPQALAIASEVDAEIADVEHAPVRAEASLRLGYVRANMADSAAADALWSAARWGGAAHDDALTARAMALLVGVEGVRARKFEAAHAIARSTEAVLQRLGDPAAQRSLLLE
ncbi:MAG TPA: serine/threonine-protein kinase, partial [Nannocystaceae bacterium]|nr:serine/threonine-protein kinase [Nannocystaceae bacterium]